MWFLPQPFASGTATKRDDAVLMRIRNLVLVVGRRSVDRLAPSPALVTFFPGTSRMTVGLP